VRRRFQFSVITASNTGLSAQAITHNQRAKFVEFQRFVHLSTVLRCLADFASVRLRIASVLRRTTRQSVLKTVAFVQYRAALCDGIANLR